jgi:hypothetical protein
MHLGSVHLDLPQIRPSDFVHSVVVIDPHASQLQLIALGDLVYLELEGFGRLAVGHPEVGGRDQHLRDLAELVDQLDGAVAAHVAGLIVFIHFDAVGVEVVTALSALDIFICVQSR